MVEKNITIRDDNRKRLKKFFRDTWRILSGEREYELWNEYLIEEERLEKENMGGIQEVNGDATA